MINETRKRRNSHGCIVHVLVDNRPSKHPAAFATQVRISDHLDLDDAATLAEAIVKKNAHWEAWLSDVLGRSQQTGEACGGWQRRFAQRGGIDEMSSGVQATYFSPDGLLAGFMACRDAEWMDE